MPSSQRGQAFRQGTTWAVRFYDETGARRRQAGFATRKEALGWLGHKLDEVDRLRRGDPSALRRREMPTFDGLCDEFEAQYSGEANSLRTLRPGSSGPPQVGADPGRPDRRP